MPRITQAIHFDYPQCVRTNPDGSPLDAIQWDVDHELGSVRDVFFIRALIELPVLTTNAWVTFSLWSTVSRANHRIALENWTNPRRASAVPPAFGYLQNHLKCYREATVNMYVNVEQRELGLRPVLRFNPEDDHPLARDSRAGITWQRAVEILAAYGCSWSDQTA